MTKVVIAGSRSFDSREIIDEYMIGIVKFLAEIRAPEISEVVSGTARGGDYQGELWARRNGIPIKKMPADWDRHGRSAGHKRNAEMAKYAGEEGIVVIFWDGASRGSAGMIDQGGRYCKHTFVKRFTCAT